MPATGKNWEARIGRRIKLRDLHVLLTVVQSGSMAKAAQQLFVTQPAISKSIAELEHALGVRLLDRGPQGVEATPYGAALVRRGLNVFDELRQGVGEIEFISNPRIGEVRVGCPETLASTLLAPVVQLLARQYPGIRLYVAHTNPIALDIGELLDRKLDLLLGRIGPVFPEEQMKAEILYHDAMVVVAGAQSKWARRRTLELAELMDEKWIMYPPGQVPGLYIEEAFRQRGLPFPPGSVQTYSLQLRDVLLANGDYLSVVAASAVPVLNAKRATVKILPIDLGRQATARPVAIFTLRDRTLSPVTELFIESVRDVAKGIASQRGGVGTAR